MSPRIKRNSRRTSVLQQHTSGKGIIKLFYLAGVVSIIMKGQGELRSFFHFVVFLNSFEQFGQE